nr:SPOR domain-containing protein [Porphyrobacter sp. GA68]
MTRHKLIGLALSTALASGALTACSGSVAPDARVSADKASQALTRGKIDAAIRHAEAAVLAQPRSAEYRSALGAAYLEAGRFQSAETSFAEAMELGGTAPRIVVSRALAQIAVGQSEAAYNLLHQHAQNIDPADLGLAFALSGDAERGVKLLLSEMHGGHNTPKVRQNLAYAFALKGDWHLARQLVSEDVQPDKVGERLGQWAVAASPGGHTLRVANILNVAIAREDHRPAQLALTNFPDTPMLAAEAATQLPVDAEPSIAVARVANAGFDAAGELPPIGRTAQSVDGSPVQAVAAPARPSTVPAAQIATAAVAAPSVRVAAAPSAASAPARAVPAKPAATAAVRPAALQQFEPGNHLVQLGSYTSEAGARAAWPVFQARFPVLKDQSPVITKAQVNGRIYYRVAAGNLAERSAQSLCAMAKAKGQGCIAYSAARPLPGTIGSPVRVAGR